MGESRPDHVPTVTAEAFEKQIRFLSKSGYRVLSPAQIADRLDRGEPFPKHSTAITFDDGYMETLTVAWPILKRHAFSAAVFVTPAEVGLPGFLTWDDVRILAREGMTVGCHTMTHSYVPLVPEDQLVHEIVDSKQVIEVQLGAGVEFLSYPIGGFTPQAQAIAAKAGYRAAFTTNRLSFSPGVDRFALRRVKITTKDLNPISLRAKLSGYYDLFRQLRRPC